jgi:N-carbamoyl-L-amino-acid hydrolase
MSNLTVDGHRLWQSLMTTAEIGGAPQGGVKRLIVTEEERKVRDCFAEACEDVGCVVTVDAFGEFTAQDQCVAGVAVRLESIVAFDERLQGDLEAI